MTDVPHHSPPLRPIWPNVVAAIGISVLAVIGMIALFYGVGQRERGEASTAEKVALAEQVRQACEAGGQAAKELGAACGKAEEITQRGEKGEPGATGPAGPRGFTGPTGPRGPAGTTPPCMLVSTRCQGRPGAPGPQGDAGAEGETGPVGDKGDTGETGQTGAQGETGATGAQGEKGEPCPPTEPACVGPAGRGVASMACVDDGEQPSAGAHWVITYTDDTTQTLPEGSCRQPMPLGQGS